MIFPNTRWASIAVVAVLGCQIELPLPHVRGSHAGGGGGGEGVRVEAEPEAPLEAVPRAVRFRIRAGFALDPGSIALVRGDVGPKQLRDIGRQEPSLALRERMVPVLGFRDGDAVVIAPRELLDPEERYTLAVGQADLTFDVRATAADARPLLKRVWPPPESAAERPFAVWCGEMPLPEVDVPMTLEPGGPAGFLRRGAVEDGAGNSCLRFDASAHVTSPPDGFIAPPFVTLVQGTWLLETLPIRAGATALPMPSIACDATEAVFGPGCARFADDRLFARSPSAPLLWAVRGAGTDTVIAVGAGDPFTVVGLPPSTDVVLDVAAIDERGTRVRMLTSAVTEPPMPHLILNEVLANPLGPEPMSEWIEIVNDGQAEAVLEGYVITDGAGETVLPQGVLAPGRFALVVNEAFTADNGVDPEPPPDTLILRVPHLGKNGLSNAGESLSLRDPGGTVISRFPALPQPKAGMSVARRTPAAPDGVASSFVVATPSPGVGHAL